MLRYVIGISFITVVIILIRALTNGKVLKKYQYAMWLLIPIYMFFFPFVKINVPFAEKISTPFQTKNNTVNEVVVDNSISSSVEVTEQKAPQDLNYLQVIDNEMVPTNKIEKSIEISIADTDKKVSVNVKTILQGAVIAVSVILLVMMAIYNAGFMICCKQKRKYVGRDIFSGLKIFKLLNKRTPFLLFNKVYIDSDTNDFEKYVISHEASHYKHGDHIWIILRYIVLILNWYNPLIWWAFVLSGYDCEMACDEEVLKIYGSDSAKEYAQALFSLLQRHNGLSYGFTVSTGMRGGYKMMKKRIESIKNPSNQRNKILAASTAALILFSSCSLINPKPAERNTDDFWYGCTSFNVPTVKGYSQMCVTSYSDGYYYLAVSGQKIDEKIEGDDTYYQLFKVNSQGECIKMVSLPAKCANTCDFAVANDKFYCLEPISNTEYVIDLNTGSVISEERLNTLYFRLFSTDDGFVKMTENEIIRYSKDGVETGRLALDMHKNYQSFYQKDGKYYLIGENNRKMTIFELLFDNNRINTVLESDISRLDSLELRNGLFFADEGVYYLDVKSKSLVPVTEWNYVDVKPAYKTTLCETNVAYCNGRFGKLYEYNDYEIELIIFNQISPDVYANRTPITIGGYQVTYDAAIQWAVYSFNTSQNEYRIYLDEYWNKYSYNSGEDGQKQIAKLIKDFNDGKAPDMFYGTNFDYRYMYNAGLVADMLPLIEKDTDFSLNELIPSVKNTITKNGVCYQIFAGFYFDGDFGLKSDFDKDNVTYTDVDALAKIKGISVRGDMPAAEFTDQILRYSLGDLVDRASGEHIVSKSDLKDIIDFSVRNGGPEGQFTNGIADFDTVKDGTYLTCRRTWMGNLYDLAEIESDLNDSFVYLGFPSIYGSAHAAHAEGLVAISSSTKYKDACWKFIKNMLTDEVQEIQLGRYNNPVMQKTLDDYCRYAAAPETVPDNEIIWNSIIAGKKPVQEWIIDDYRSMVNSIDSVISYDWGLYSIITNEVNSYYLQGKNIDAIAETLQSRIDLYVAENYK